MRKKRGKNRIKLNSFGSFSLGVLTKMSKKIPFPGLGKGYIGKGIFYKKNLLRDEIPLLFYTPYYFIHLITLIYFLI